MRLGIYCSLPVLGFALLVSCSDGGEVVGGDNDGGPAEVDAQSGAATIDILRPTPNESFDRTSLGNYGDLVAKVPVSLNIRGPIHRIEITDAAGNLLLSFLVTIQEPTFHIELTNNGNQKLSVSAFDETDSLILAEDVDIVINAPQASTCFEWLELYQVDFSAGPTRPGVPNPVTVKTPINGIAYRYISNENPRNEIFMDCSLALSLVQSAPFLHRRDVLEVADIGIYNYRCIGGGAPPNCPNGISQHAYAKAIDIAGYTTGDGFWYSVNDDWVIDGDNENTCTAPTENEKDLFLHDLICELKENGIWNIVLTPNYNAGHRNHFHVDLTPGSNYINFVRTPMCSYEPPAALPKKQSNP